MRIVLRVCCGIIVGPYRKEISALVGALHERVPQELKGSWQTAMSPEAMRARLVQRMEDHRGLAPDVAEWAVDTWSHALGIGLGRRSDRLASVVLDDSKKQDANKDGGAAFGAGLAGGIAAGMTDAERRKAIESDRPGGDSQAPGLLAGVETSKKKAGIGAGILALVAVAAVIALHRPTPTPPPQPPPQPAVVVPPDSTKKDDGGTKPTPVPANNSIAAGTPISIRLNQGFESDQTTVGQTYTATLAAPLMLNGKIAVPIGADATIKVSTIDLGHKFTGQTMMQISLVSISSGGKTYPVSATLAQILGPKQAVVATERGAIGGAAGAVGGFIAGKILHHPKAGTLTGTAAGGTVGAATTKTQPAKAKRSSCFSSA